MPQESGAAWEEGPWLRRATRPSGPVWPAVSNGTCPSSCSAGVRPKRVLHVHLCQAACRVGFRRPWVGSGSSLRIFIKLKNQQTLRTACTCNAEQKQQLKSPGTTREGRGVGWEGGVPEEPALSAGPWATRKTRPAEGGAEKRLKPENHLPAEQEGHQSTAGRGLPGTYRILFCSPDL